MLSSFKYILLRNNEKDAFRYYTVCCYHLGGLEGPSGSFGRNRSRRAHEVEVGVNGLHESGYVVEAVLDLKRER